MRNCQARVMKCEESKSRCENAAFLPSVCLCRASVELGAEGGIQNSTFNFWHSVTITCMALINQLANILANLRLGLPKLKIKLNNTHMYWFVHIRSGLPSVWINSRYHPFKNIGKKRGIVATYPLTALKAFFLISVLGMWGKRGTNWNVMLVGNVTQFPLMDGNHLESVTIT